MSKAIVWVVTDPMCSWCWGMSAAIEEAAHQLADEVEFDLLLGGINTHATQPIGDYGRRVLMKIWQEVQATTGQPFGFKLPEEFVYNSTLACVAIQALRRHSKMPPFGFLHRLQQCLFVDGRNLNDAQVLVEIAEEFEFEGRDLLNALRDDSLAMSVRNQFSDSRTYGTHALPNVLIEEGSRRRLLFGGYADSEMITTLVRQALAQP